MTGSAKQSMVQHARRGFASLAMTPENSGNFRWRHPRLKALVTHRERPLTRSLRFPTPHAIHLFANDNAEFYERKIVTSKSKSCLMRFMGASDKLFK
jgi:hypothetical protein